MTDAFESTTNLVRVADVNVRVAPRLVRVADVNVRVAPLLVRVADVNVRSRHFWSATRTLMSGRILFGWRPCRECCDSRLWRILPAQPANGDRNSEGSLAPTADITLRLFDSNRQPIATNVGSGAGSSSLQAALQFQRFISCRSRRTILPHELLSRAFCRFLQRRCGCWRLHRPRHYRLRRLLFLLMRTSQCTSSERTRMEQPALAVSC